MFIRKISLGVLSVLCSQFISPAYTTDVMRAPPESVGLVGEGTVARAAVVKAAAVVTRPARPWGTVDAQVAAYDALYDDPRNRIATLADCSTVVVAGYGPIAEQGLAYVRHHFPTDGEVLARCARLERELADRMAERGGLTPVEFILFNMKLALSQSVYAGAFPLNIDYDIKRIVTDGRWLETPFYVSKDIYRTYDDTINILLDATLRDTHLIFVDPSCAFKPFVIYTPKGGFRVTRIMRQLLCHPDGKNRGLIALPIGVVALENSPHGVFNRDPYSFLVHDLSHALDCRINLKQPFTQKLLTLMALTDDKLQDALLATLLFLHIHENTFSITPILDKHSSLNAARTLGDMLKVYQTGMA